MPKFCKEIKASGLLDLSGNSVGVKEQGLNKKETSLLT